MILGLLTGAVFSFSFFAGVEVVPIAFQLIYTLSLLQLRCTFKILQPGLCREA